MINLTTKNMNLLNFVTVRMNLFNKTLNKNSKKEQEPECKLWCVV